MSSTAISNYKILSTERRSVEFSMKENLSVNTITGLLSIWKYQTSFKVVDKTDHNVKVYFTLSGDEVKERVIAQLAIHRIQNVHGQKGYSIKIENEKEITASKIGLMIEPNTRAFLFGKGDEFYDKVQEDESCMVQ